jgi:hypothetical protein
LNIEKCIADDHARHSQPLFDRSPRTRLHSAAIETADRSSRNWTSASAGALRPGTETHKRDVCRMFRETFNPYRPSVIDWPKLSAETVERLMKR